MNTSIPDCFALFDDSEASRERPASRLYRGFVREHRCIDPAGLDAMWAAVDADLRGGLQAVLLIDYEWGAKLLQAGHGRLAEDDASALHDLQRAEAIVVCNAPRGTLPARLLQTEPA